MKHKGAKTIRRIGKIGKYLFLAIVALMIFFSVVFVVACVDVAVNPGHYPDGSTDGILNLLCDTLTVSAVLAIIFYYLYGLASNLSRSETPFETANVVLMKRVALVCALGFVAIMIVRVALFLVLDVPDVQFNIDLTPLFMAIVVYFLALVFQYGVELQEESDSFL